MYLALKNCKVSFKKNSNYLHIFRRIIRFQTHIYRFSEVKIFKYHYFAKDRQ